MKVKDALKIGELASGKIVAGEKGIFRKIETVEVMEVPEVLNWATPGMLVLTTFYSIKDDPDKQIQVVKDLISIGAAGLVIKVGRFIDTLPEEMIAITNQHDFPIITLPKNISYINVLTPLYECLYKEKYFGQGRSENPLSKFGAMEIDSVQEALDVLSKMLNGSVYIEDNEGRLLYAAKNFTSDGWRKSTALFSLPTYQRYDEMLEEWTTKFSHTKNILFSIEGYRKQMIIPLTYKNRVFAVVHIHCINSLITDPVFQNHLEEVGNKLKDVLLKEQLYNQRKRLNDYEQMNGFLKGFDHLDQANEKNNVIIHFYSDSLNIPHSNPSLIDYEGLIRNKLMDFIEQLQIHKSQVFIFMKNRKFYALLTGIEENYSEMVQRWKNQIEAYNKLDPLRGLYVSISPYFGKGANLDTVVQSVTKIIEVGSNVKKGEYVYTYNEMGIYQFLLNLIDDPFAKQYALNFLAPLLEDKKNDLLKTLEVYLQENGNVSKSAEILFIHRRTMTYRLKKIEQLLNIDLNNSENRFILIFCLKIMKIA